MMGTTGQAEIDQDEKRMIAAGFMDKKIEQFVTYVELDEFHSSEHDAAREAERYCIREVGVNNLLNSNHGRAGRIPNDTSVGGAFLLVGVKSAVSRALPLFGFQMARSCCSPSTHLLLLPLIWTKIDSVSNRLNHCP